MEDLVLNLLKQEKVDSILNTCVVSYKELSWMRVSYFKAGKYYNASVFFTDMWMSKKPLGPLTGLDGYVWITSIYDVAAIFVYSSYTECISAPKMTERDFEVLYRMFNENAKSFVSNNMKEYMDYVHKVSFCFSPKPTIIIALCDKEKNFIGSFAIGMNNDISILVCSSPLLLDIIDSIKEILCKDKYVRYIMEGLGE